MSEGAFWPVTIEVKVPWRDLDAAGHVNNANYFSYFESARVEAFQRMTGTKDPRDLHIILARTECDFVSPAHMNEVLRVSAWPTRVGGSSFALAYDIREKDTGRVVARGASVQVAFDYAKGAKKEVPPEWRRVLEAGIPSADEKA